MESQKITIEAFREQFLQPVVYIKSIMGLDGNPLYHSLPYWRRHKLLPFIPKGSWGYELSMSQVIWLRILDHLRALGYPVKDTEKIADYFFKDAYFADLPTQNLRERKQTLEKKSLAGTLDQEDTLILSELDRILHDPILLYGLKFDISYLSNLVVWCLNIGVESGIRIYRDGKVAERRGDEISNHNKESFDLEAPHIYISIKSLLDEFINSKELSARIAPFLLTEDETYVIRELRRKNISNLNIVVRSERIIRIDSETQQTLVGDQAEEIKKLFLLKNYEEVSISTRDSKTLTFQKKNKKMTSGKPGS